MKCIAYMIRQRIKNSLAAFIHAPVKLILAIVTAAIFVGSIFFISVMPNVNAVYLDSAYFKGICFIYMLFLMFLSAPKGLGNGSTLFSMSDVNLLFTAPISPKKALVYGMASDMMKTTGATLVIILTQAGWLKYAGINSRAIVLLLLFCTGGGLLFFMLAQVIYTFSHGNKKRKTAVIIIMSALFIPLIIQIILEVPKYDFVSCAWFAVHLSAC